MTNASDPTFFPSAQVNDWISHLVGGLKQHFNHQLNDVAMIGIMTGGVTVAEQLHKELHLSVPMGQLNISFYRDDFSHIGLHPVVSASELPFSVEDRHIVLVDDVLNTGRTIRAALNEIFDYGRPASVSLAVLVERGGRELPICADVSGHKLTLDANQHIKLNPDTMDCSIRNAEIS